MNEINFKKKIKKYEYKNITLDLAVKKFDSITIFITTNSFYIEEFYYILNTLN